MTWEEEFEENYNVKDISEWTLGIVASALIHGMKKPFGTSAGHITAKLRNLISSEIESAVKSERETQAKLREIAINNLITDVNTARKEERERIVKILDKEEGMLCHDRWCECSQKDLESIEYIKKLIIT